MSRRICRVVNGGCRAPAGVRVGGGVGEGYGSCRGACACCGEWVCANPACSKIMVWRGLIKRHPLPAKRRRICADCQELLP